MLYEVITDPAGLVIGEGSRHGDRGDGLAVDADIPASRPFGRDHLVAANDQIEHGSLSGNSARAVPAVPAEPISMKFAMIRISRR